ncbi:Ctr copper transporter family-domain-containing protein [Dunaliella salina]|uniref:Copper transport protein n=1 Tax=Dunaliella salina TaxID=3046 RepID=A0ABQ7HA72_DUNSA|nr:Ctr copper transporter family-domain-containing protein [Dunaliella salina]|eukprot:KAF5843751.1 Ctr copper transporter family-domain-containing protein [Dunaliella salina]
MKPPDKPAAYPASLGLLFLALLCVCAYQSAQNTHHRHDVQHQGGGDQQQHSAAEHAGSEMGMMPMYFVNTCKATLWFRGWVTDGPVSYALSMCFLVAFAIAHEALAVHRSSFLGKLSRESKPRRISPMEKFWLALLYALNMGTSYLLMLAVMTYNIGFCVAVVLGLGTGYFMLIDMTAGCNGNLGGASLGGNDSHQGVLGRADACCDLGRGMEQT